VLGLIVKKSCTIALILAGLVVARFLLWPAVTLEWAKQQAIRKFSSADSRALNCVPSSSVLSIPRLEITSPYSVVQPPGCEVGLPDSEFQRDTTHKVVFANSNLLVACFGTLDKTNYTFLEHELGRSNVFDVVSSAYQATVTGISEQRSMTQLRQYLALLLYKATVAPVGFQHSWLRFDRGDLSGFISGDLAGDDRVAVEIYIKEKDEFLVMLIRRRAKTGAMSDVYHILSVLTVRPNTKIGVTGITN
jgi:hypothetical protein